MNIFASKNIRLNESETHNSQPFCLYGKAFHRINQLSRADEKTYSIVSQGFTFQLSRKQMLLLSTAA
jgi:hypothetical protein